MQSEKTTTMRDWLLLSLGVACAIGGVILGMFFDRAFVPIPWAVFLALLVGIQLTECYQLAKGASLQVKRKLCVLAAVFVLLIVISIANVFDVIETGNRDNIAMATHFVFFLGLSLALELIKLLLAKGPLG